MNRTALISQCGKYRYSLGREWRDGLDVVWVMLNPSTADAESDDATIRRCVGFSQRWGFGSLTVVNLFAFRSTTVRGLTEARDPTGPLNDRWLKHTFADAREIVCAWGCVPIPLGRRISAVIKLIPEGPRVVCLGRTADGHPRHPVRLAYAVEREEYRL